MRTSIVGVFVLLVMFTSACSFTLGSSCRGTPKAVVLADAAVATANAIVAVSVKAASDDGEKRGWGPKFGSKISPFGVLALAFVASMLYGLATMKREPKKPEKPEEPQKIDRRVLDARQRALKLQLLRMNRQDKTPRVTKTPPSSQPTSPARTPPTISFDVRTPEQ